MLLDVTLRQMNIDDGSAINTLAAQCPDKGLISVYSVYRDNALESLQALRPNTVSVAAEVSGHDGLIGMAQVSFDQCRIEGGMIPCALFNTLMVHPDFRRQGVARRLSEWSMEQARLRFGDKGVMMADIQMGNKASDRTVKKWCNQVLPPFMVAPVSLKNRPPVVFSGIRIGAVEPGALAEFADRLNIFYEGHNFYKPETADSLSAWLEERPFGLPIHHCLAARDLQGNLLAGLTLEEAHQLRTYHVVHMPPWIRMVNKLLHAVPADGILRHIQVGRIWFRPGQLAAARHLWESVRWLWRRRGTSLMVFFDGRSPVASVINLKPWSIKTVMNTVVKSPVPIRESRFIYPIS